MAEKTSHAKSDDRHRVLIVDDHPLIRQGLVQLLNEERGIEVCGEAGNGREALELAAAVKPELLILDLRLPDRDGIDLISDLKAHDPGLLILVLTMRDEQVYAERALSAGAAGYVMKGHSPDVVLAAINRVLDGQVYLSEEMTAAVLKRFAGHGHPEQISSIDLLSRRELQVMSLIGQGLGPKEIGKEMHISVRTVETHRENIKIKLGLDDAAALRKFAIQWVQREL
jgi:DNA-binding NarL/FixJ family response regulator